LTNEDVLCLFIPSHQVKEVFDAIAPAVGLSVASAVGQSSIADEISVLIRKSKQGLYPTLDEEFVEMEPQTQVDILVATPGRLMDHINMTKGFSLEHLQYLVRLTTSTISVSSLHTSFLIQRTAEFRCDTLICTVSVTMFCGMVDY
jgi:hypothetical protein